MKRAFILISFLLNTSCAVGAIKAQGIQKDSLALCGEKPNCVSSFDKREKFYISPVSFEKAPSKAIDTIKTYLDMQERVEIISARANYIHAVFTSKIMGFNDDVEIFIKDSKIYFRSVSRTGYSDLGVNRERIEKIRGHLQVKLNH